jgi:hypothetical protein
LSGAFGAIREPEETIEELAAKIGCSVADLIVAVTAGAPSEDDDDMQICNPPAGASWVVDRTTPRRTIPKTQAERFGDFMASSRPPIAQGTVRRYFDSFAIEITGTVDRFHDGSDIRRVDGSLATEIRERHT